MPQITDVDTEWRGEVRQMNRHSNNRFNELQTNVVVLVRLVNQLLDSNARIEARVLDLARARSEDEMASKEFRDALLAGVAAQTAASQALRDYLVANTGDRQAAIDAAIAAHDADDDAALKDALDKIKADTEADRAAIPQVVSSVVANTPASGEPAPTPVPSEPTATDQPSNP